MDLRLSPAHPTPTQATPARTPRQLPRAGAQEKGRKRALNMERGKVKKKEKGKELEKEKIREKEKEGKGKEVEKEKIEKEKEKEKGKKDKSKSKEEKRKEWETEKEKEELKGEGKKEKDNSVLAKTLLELPVRDHLGPLRKAIVGCSAPFLLRPGPNVGYGVSFGAFF